MPLPPLSVFAYTSPDPAGALAGALLSNSIFALLPRFLPLGFLPSVSSPSPDYSFVSYTSSNMAAPPPLAAYAIAANLAAAAGGAGGPERSALSNT